MFLKNNGFRALAVGAMACFATLIASPSLALDAIPAQLVEPEGATGACRFKIGADGGIVGVVLEDLPFGNNLYKYTGDSLYFGNDGFDAGQGALTQFEIESWCAMTGVTIITLDGATVGAGTLASDAYMGIVFQGTSSADGIRRQYEFALSGAVGTTIVSTATVISVNNAPTANAGTDQTVASGATVTLAGSGTDPDSDPLTYSWSQTAGTTVSLSSTSAAGPTFTAPTLVPGASNETLTFSLIVNDGTDDSVADTVDITVTPPANVLPTADAGLDQTVQAPTTVTLDGSASSSNNVGQTLTYGWVQTSGTAVTLSSSSAVSPTFSTPTLAIGDPDAILVFELTVSEDTQDEDTDTVQITVQAPANTPPVANAGLDQSVNSAESVTLSGSGTDADAHPFSFQWTQVSGTTVTLSNTAVASPTFTAPTLAVGSPSEDLVFQLVLNDGFDDSDPDQVTITVNPPANTVPIANAGPDQAVDAGSTVTLSGSATDPDGQTITYVWSQTAGSAVTLSSTTAASPTFTAPAMAIGDPDIILTFSLIVNDGVASSSADSVTITVSAPTNIAPVANAGTDLVVASGASVTLTGSGVDQDNDPLTLAWSQLSGTTVSLSSTTAASPTFTAPTLAVNGADEVLEFQLIVNDGTVDSAPDTVLVTVVAPTNSAPVADAGVDQVVASGASVTLSGGATDGDADDLTYVWSQLSGTTVSLSSTTATEPTFTAPTLAFNGANEVLEFQLIANDGTEDSAPDTVLVTVVAPQDTTRPTVTMTASGSNFQLGENITVQVTFSEPVSGVSEEDFLIENATIVELFGGTTTKVSSNPTALIPGFVSSATLVLSPTKAASPVTVQMLADAVSDEAGNTNLASALFAISPNAFKLAEEGNAEGMSARARALMLAQPDLRSLMHDRSGKCFALRVREDSGSACVSTMGDAPFWTSLQGVWSRSSGNDQRYVNLTFGAHLMQSDSLIVGAMVQLDDTKADVTEGTFEGQGWLAGPYVVGRINGTELIYSASLLHGRAENRLEIADVSEGDFTSRRTLATLGLEGRYDVKDGLTLIPALDVAYVEDVQEAYTDDQGNKVGSQVVSLSESSFGIGFEQTIARSSSVTVLTGELSGVHSMYRSAVETTETTRGRIDAGVRIKFDNMTEISLSAFYDGLGVDDYEATGANVLFQKKF
ncbi:MAG: Ig-like domain-containing protein [Pseudomonadota bacterium]|nr:Ig-like domain-containing protein [Pseudomonadota bacterium]